MNFTHGNSDPLMHHQQFTNIHDESEVFEIESSNSIASELFIQPKNYNHQPYTSSPKKDKELNLSDYFKSLQM
mgnify:FL=1